MPLFDRIGRDMSLQVNARADDLVRMTKLLASYQGARFLTNQALLRASNFDATKGERKQSVIDSVVDVSSVTASIISQVAVNGTGTHFLSNELGAQMGKTPYFTGNGNAATEAKYTGYVEVLRDNRNTPVSDKLSASNSMIEMTGRKGYQFDAFHEEFSELKLDYTRPGTIRTTFDKFNDSIFLEDGMTSDSTPLAKLVSKDTLPVVFGIVNQTHSSLPFRGFVQGINDSFNANWNTINYVGRNEPLYIYDHTTRTLGFTLQIPIFSKKSTKRIYQRVNALMSYMYGRYGNTTSVDRNSRDSERTVEGINQGTVLSIRVGDYFRGYGIMTSLSHNIAQEVPWSSTAPHDVSEATVEDRVYHLTNDGGKHLILPQVLTLQLSFNIIHEKKPQRMIPEDGGDYLPFVGVGNIKIKSEQE